MIAPEDEEVFRKACRMGKILAAVRYGWPLPELTPPATSAEIEEAHELRERQLREWNISGP